MLRAYAKKYFPDILNMLVRHYEQTLRDGMGWDGIG
jgi:hypothetical protein